MTMVEVDELIVIGLHANANLEKPLLSALCSCNGKTIILMTYYFARRATDRLSRGTTYHTYLPYLPTIPTKEKM